MERYYQTLLKMNVLPPLATFRQFPSVKLAQETRDLAQFEPLVRGEVESWLESARAKLCNILGFPVWNSTDPERSHPVDRATAWFRCSKCLEASSSKTSVIPLDFRGACAHECRERCRKLRAKQLWSADQFIKDEKVRRRRALIYPPPRTKIYGDRPLRPR